MFKTSKAAQEGALCRLTATETNLCGNYSAHSEISHDNPAGQSYKKVSVALPFVVVPMIGW